MDILSEHPLLFSSILGIALLWFINFVQNYVTIANCNCKERLDGKTVIITGCSDGIGKETALDLAKRGARIIMACRNLEKTRKVRDYIVRATNNQEVVVKELNVSLLCSVRAFAEDINNNEDRLDVLIHNAGIRALSKGEPPLTKDGIHKIWATNFYGPFLLTHLLIGLLKKTGKSRIIFVSSEACRLGRLREDNVNPQRQILPHSFYSSSKLAINQFSIELARRLQGTGVTANSLTPGVVWTKIFNPAPFWYPIFLSLIIQVKNVKQGAQTTIHLAASEQMEGVTGKYFRNCKIVSFWRKAMDVDVAKIYWELWRNVVSLKPSEINI